MRELYQENHGTGWGLLLVDAKNVFNSLIRAAVLWNAQVLCITNFGRACIFLFSKEGVGQGEPLSMLMYTATMTLLT